VDKLLGAGRKNDHSIFFRKDPCLSEASSYFFAGGAAASPSLALVDGGAAATPSSEAAR
jgi:hypothetical protein